MNTMKKILAALLLVLAVLAVPETGYALRDVIQPPMITVVAYGAPRDLQMTVMIHKEDRVVPAGMEKERRGWESVFRIYRENVFDIKAWYGNDYDLGDAVIVASSGGVERELTLPREGLSNSRNDFFTLNWKTGVITTGLPRWRAAALAAMRILAGLLIELAVFFLYGFREKKTWVVLILVNLVTLGIWAWIVSGWLNALRQNLVWLILAAIMSFLGELAVILMLVDERDRNRTVSCLTVANGASLLAEILALSFLPM